MNHAGKFFRILLGLVLPLGMLSTPSEGQTPRAELLKRSNIVFTGTIQQVGAVSFVGVPPSTRTAVVRVDTVLEKPQAVALSQGDRVTVEVKDPTVLQPGTRATFYTDGWIYGAGIAVREVGHEIIPASLESRTAAAAQRATEVSQARKELNDADLRSRIDGADIIIVGRVVSIRPAPVTAQAGRTTRITEHDPAWQEAVVRVVDGIKGAQANQEIVVRFPGSLDVAWHGLPKFRTGQEGTFLLQKDKVTGAPKATLAGASVDAYTALDPVNVMRKDQADRVRSLTKP
jgi:hypothetical protein